MSVPWCPYCRNEAKLVTGREIYPHRPDLFDRRFWQCKPCGAHVGCHAGSRGNAALGRLANAELRKLKMEAHAAFDPIWKTGKMKRKEAYSYLADRMKVKVKECHIGYFSEDQCRRVIEIAQEDLT